MTAQSHNYWLARSISCLIIAVGVSSGLLASDTKPSLSKLRASYIDSSTSIRTIQYDIEIERIQLKKLSTNVIGSDFDYFVKKQARVVRDGEKFARATKAVSKSGEWSVESWSAFDGLRYSDWRTSTSAPKGQAQLPQGHIRFTPAEAPMAPSMALFSGTLVYPNHSLQQLLGQAGLQVLGPDKIDGALCWKVEFPPVVVSRSTPDYKVQTAAWFDPAHGYLPRCIQTSKFESEDNKTFIGSYTTTEFQQIGHGENQYWIPRSGTQESGHGYTASKIVFSNIVICPQKLDHCYESSG